MSVDKSLKMSGKLRRHRSVLSRAERIERLIDEEKWEDGKSVFGLPKVKTVRVRRRGKAKEKPEAAEAQAEGTEAPAEPPEAQGEAKRKPAS